MPSLAAMLIGLERLNAGFRSRSVQIANHTVVYSEGGRGETLVLVHGFGSSRDSWNRMASRLTKRYRVIAPDLPGWGESTRLDEESYGYPKQVERLRQFIAALGLGRAHMIGHSMGGCIASAYAAQFPDDVVTLGLISAHGVAEPEPGELAQSAAKGDNWLVPATVPEFERLLSNVFSKRPYLPKSVFRVLANRTVQGYSKSVRIFAEIARIDPPLESRLPRIKAPTLIVWGDRDRAIHVSCAEVFRRGISRSDVLIIPGSGHMPLVENARQCTTAWLAFVEQQSKSARAAA